MKNFILGMFAFILISAAKGVEPNLPNPITPPHLKMVLPEVIYAAPGIESNIYFENVIDSAAAHTYAFEVKCERGTQGKYRWYWTPRRSDAGKTFELELRVFNDFGMVLSGKCRVMVANDSGDRKQPITLALLADSGVNCQYPAYLLDTMRQAGFCNYTPVGRHAGGGKPVKKGGAAHDGYGGFSWNCFLSRWAYSAEELPNAQNEAERKQMIALGVRDVSPSQAYRLRSPLLSIVNGEKVLDIPGWFKQINNGNAPDFIIIQLGCNDMFSVMAPDLESSCRKVIKNAKILLAALRKHAPNAVIGVATGITGGDQDGFGTDYKTFQTQYQFRRNIQCYNREISLMIKELNDPEIILLPLHQAVDPEHSYFYKSYPAHARSTEQVDRHSNALHLNSTGGQQISDAVYCWLRKQLEK